MKTKKKIHHVLTAGLLALGLALPATASADFAGLPGTLLGFEHVDDSSDDYNFTGHGSIIMDDGDATPRAYRWGGSFCPGRVLDVAQQQLLVTAMAGKLVVLPYYKLGNGGERCLTSFILTPRATLVPKVAK